MIKGTTKTGSRLAFVLLALGCGGKAETLVGAGGDETAAGSPSIAVAGSSAGGSPSVDVGGAAGLSAGGATPIGTGGGGAGNGELGGAVGVAGAPAIAYCGVMLAAPTTQTVPFAPTAVVWERIQSFLGTAAEIPPGLLVTATPQLAGALADHALISLKGAPAPGLASFVSAWWPGTPNAQAWATLFGDPNVTFTDLLTTTSVAKPGSGVLTDPAVLMLPEISMRGAFIDQHLLCMQVPPSPPNVPGLGPAMPGQTRRQQLEQALLPNPSCSPCHRLMDPIGDSLEHYDTFGVFNMLDNGSPINSAGALTPFGTITSDITFTDVNQLGSKLAKECGVPLCLAQQLLADAETSAKLPVLGSTNPQVTAAIANATTSGKLRDLLHNIVESDTFLRAN